MKTLELENLKMSELSLDEKKVTNGGCDAEGICPMGVVAAVWDFTRGFVNGWLEN